MEQELKKSGLLPFPNFGKEEHERILKGPQCVQHNCSLKDCFEKHQGPILKIVLPCHHMIDRPESDYVKVTCKYCREEFILTSEAGGRSWDATSC